MLYLIVPLNMFLHNIILNPFLKSHINVSDLVTCFLSRSCIRFADKTTTIKLLLIYALILLYKQKIAKKTVLKCFGQISTVFLEIRPLFTALIKAEPGL